VPGVWRLIELAKSCKEEDGGMPDIILIQEVRAETAERLQLERAWKALGYYPYSQEGLSSKGRWEADRSNGGVMTCVKMEWDQKLLKKQRMGVAQQVVVEVGSWKVSNFYSPPGKREDINKMVVEMLVMDDGSPVFDGRRLERNGRRTLGTASQENRNRTNKVRRRSQQHDKMVGQQKNRLDCD
jgi:exonuclease III